VILASGAFQSPQLLMLSGIGDGEALAAHGIGVVHHLPGVGRNLQDHPDFVFVYASDYPHFVQSRSVGCHSCSAPFSDTAGSGAG
jgi:choline dehydrogenase-like flavoprotein